MAQSDTEDLQLLKSSLEILEQTSELVQSCKRPYELCKCLYNIAEACISSHRTLNEEVSQSEDGVVVLPLQQPMDGAWPYAESDLQSFSSSLQADNWGASNANSMPLVLDSQINTMYYGGVG